MIKGMVERLKHAKPEDILYFLQDFHLQKSQFGIIFYERRKNNQALLDLEITANRREEVIDGLRLENYYKGPRPDGVNVGAEFWEFGSWVKKREVYIKLSLGVSNQAVRCFSFHPAERPIKYPFR